LEWIDLDLPSAFVDDECCQDRRGSGCVLSQCVFIDGFFPPMVMGNNCGSFQSFLAVGLLQIWASGALDTSGALDAGDNQRRSSPMRMVRTEARDLLVFFLFFSMGFSACLLGQLSTPIYLFICIFARFPYPVIQIHFIKKKIPLSVLRRPLVWLASVMTILTVVGNLDQIDLHSMVQ